MKELIETLWNVKREEIHSSFNCCKELIETLWNVKVRNGRLQVAIFAELIETLWNVKLDTPEDYEKLKKN